MESKVVRLQHHGPDAQDPEGEREGAHENRADQFKHGVLLVAVPRCGGLPVPGRKARMSGWERSILDLSPSPPQS